MGGKSKNHGRQVNRAKARKAGGKTTELEKELASLELKELLKDDTFLAGGMLYSTCASATCLLIKNGAARHPTFKSSSSACGVCHVLEEQLC